MKEDLITAIRQGMSEALLSFVDEKTFGTVEEVASPATEAEAIIATGKVNANFNNAILVPLSGFPFAEAMLRFSQLSETQIGLLLASLEINPDAVGFDITLPEPGSIWVLYDFGPNGAGQDLLITITANPEKVTTATFICNIAGVSQIGPFEMTKESEDTYTFHLENISGTGVYTFVFSVTWGSDDNSTTLSHSVTVEVRS